MFDERNRYDGIVSGKIRYEGESHIPIRYESVGTLYGEPHEAQVSWPTIGEVPVDEARKFAKAILLACDRAEVGPRELEPKDRVTYDDLPRRYIAWVESVDYGVGVAEVTEFLPGGDKTSGRGVTKLIRELERVIDE